MPPLSASPTNDFVDRCVSRLLDLFDCCIRAGGPLFVFFGLALVTAVAVFFFLYPLVPLPASSPERIAMCAVGGLLYVNIVFNWLACVATSPGRPPLVAAPTPMDTTCHRCERWKPARAHHCHVCNACVLAYDHHCPWMANCIGFGNYRYFVLTLAWLVLGCAFCLYTTTKYFQAPQALWRGGVQGHGLVYPVLFTLMMSGAAGPAVGLLLAWHVFLIVTGQSTVEFYTRRTEARMSHRGQRPSWNEFDLGYVKNWERVFGPSRFPLHWARLSLRPPPGDGVNWQTARSLASSLV
jgi:palmitoyltransferase